MFDTDSGITDRLGLGLLNGAVALPTGFPLWVFLNGFPFTWSDWLPAMSIIWFAGLMAASGMIFKEKLLADFYAKIWEWIQNQIEEPKWPLIETIVRGLLFLIDMDTSKSVRAIKIVALFISIILLSELHNNAPSLLIKYYISDSYTKTVGITTETIRIDNYYRAKHKYKVDGKEYTLYTRHYYASIPYADNNTPAPPIIIYYNKRNPQFTTLKRPNLNPHIWFKFMGFIVFFGGTFGLMMLFQLSSLSKNKNKPPAEQQD